MILALLILAATLRGAQFPVDGNGWIVTGLPTTQNNLLGPLIPINNSPWTFGDAAEIGTISNIVPAALAEAPVLGKALSGTASWTQGTSTLRTTADLRSALSGVSYIAATWASVDGVATGRYVCSVGTVTATTIDCSSSGQIFEPSSSGVSLYIMPGPDSHGWDFRSWTAGQPNYTWNYYDVAIGLYRLYYRTGITTYQAFARQFADIHWQWSLDHGYTYQYPRAQSMISQFFRALDGHPERFPYLYLIVQESVTNFGRFIQFCPYCDPREDGYTLWWVALGAKTDTDPTRHAQYCSWLTRYTPYWASLQQSDGSWGERLFASNSSYADTPSSYVGPNFIWLSSGWRTSIALKAVEAAYESLNDTTVQGCNQPAIAATALTAVTNNVTWEHNYARDSSNRGVYYETNSQSSDQNTVGGIGTVSINLGSPSLVGVGTNWQSAGYCEGTHFVGIISGNDPRTVYKIASCADNTHATLSAAFGVLGESSNVSGSAISYAPGNTWGCNSSAPFCFGLSGDRNLTRTMCGAMGWLYAQTRNFTYLVWADECASATLGGPSSGLTNASSVGSTTLPCSGPLCDGYVGDFTYAAANCSVAKPPCVNGSNLYDHLAKDWGEAFGAPGIDNELAWRLLPSGGLTCDLNHDGAINVLDVQLMTNQVLGITACTNDLTLTGPCNVVDVQRVVNAVLGGPCRIGP